MAGMNFTWVGVLHPDRAADELERVAKMLREGFTSGELYEGGRGWWESDAIDEEDEEDDDDTIPA